MRMQGLAPLQITLPTEQQWQRAAQGDDGRKYPWGNKFDASLCNTQESDIGQTTPVTQYSKGVSPYGVMGMSGNVWEWCLTKWKSGNINPQGSNRRVLRGGFWYGTEHYARVASRLSSTPDLRGYVHGFRLVSAPV